MNDAAAAIALHEVTLRYGGRFVLRGVSAAAQQGTLIGLCGANGAGKTSLMRLVLGLLPPASGSVAVLGGDPYRSAAVRRRIGYLPQSSRLNRHLPLSVRDLVGLGLLRVVPLSRCWRAPPSPLVDEALAVFDLSALADKPLRELSGGQTQLALLARAIAGRPRLLLLDEPLTGLDRDRQIAFYQRLAAWQRLAGATVVAVCHEGHALHGHADSLWRLEDGLVGTSRVPA